MIVHQTAFAVNNEATQLYPQVVKPPLRERIIKRLLDITAAEETVEPGQIPEVGLRESLGQALDGLLSGVENQK